MKIPEISKETISLLLFLVFILLFSSSCSVPTPPTITITLPSEGLNIASSNVTVSTVTNNFKLIDKIGQSSEGQNEGHIIYYLDVTPPTHYGWTALTQRGTYVSTVNTTYTWENVRPGQHTIGVQLVTSDNRPLDVPQFDTVNINVVIPPTQPTIVNVIATDGFFDISTISVSAGAEVIVTFVNEDNSPHNFSVYQDSSASITIFQGKVITGPGSITYRFTAPGMPGDYYFRSDVNPETMSGIFKVISE